MFAAYASSADLEVRTDNSAFVEEVYRALKAFGFGDFYARYHSRYLHYGRRYELSTALSPAERDLFRQYCQELVQR
jgi:hypothetical protein